MNEILAFWSGWSVATATASGVAMAAIIVHLRPRADTRLTSYLALVIGVIWYVPLIIQRAMDHAAPDGSDLRTIGTFLLYEVAFVIPMTLALAWYRRTHP